jgi:hypothetical protein
MPCPHCASTTTRERPARTQLGYRTFSCRTCRHSFNERTGTPFNHLMFPTDIVLQVVLWRLRYLFWPDSTGIPKEPERDGHRCCPSEIQVAVGLRPCLLDGRAPPGEVIKQRGGVLGQLREIAYRLALLPGRQEVGALKVRPVARRRHMQLDGHLPQMLHRPRPADHPVAHEGCRLAAPLGVGVVKGVLEHRGDHAVVLAHDEDEAVEAGDGLLPATTSPSAPQSACVSRTITRLVDYFYQQPTAYKARYTRAPPP